MSDMVIPSLLVEDATVSLIKPFVIPDVFFKFKELKPGFSSLGSMESYSQFYRELEGLGKKKGNSHPVEILGLGPVCPMSKKHTLHSYWRYFRLTVEKSAKMGRDVKELFFFLPLVISLPKNRISVNGKNFTVKISAYLFPFGSCIVILDVSFSNIRLLDFVDFARNIKGSNILSYENNSNLGTFEKLSSDVVNKIAAALFEVREPEKREVLESKTHKFIFIRKTSITLSEFGNLCKKAIAALITGQTLQNLLYQDDQTIESYFQVRMHRNNLGEILVFNEKGSLFYPDPDWLKREGKESANCMLNNYQSCLNVLLAAQSFLFIYGLRKQTEVTKERLDELKSALSLAFLEPPDPPSKIYFGHVYTKIASKIGLDKSLLEVT